jgi:hypothetical protein
MLQDIVEARPLDGYNLYLRFEDGAEGVVDVAKLLPFEGVFLPLKDLARFREVTVNPEWGTICWPNGADLDPDVLYSQITNSPLPRALHETSESSFK